MKKMLVVAVTLFSFAAISAPQELLRVHIAGKSGLVKAATDFGEMTQNPFLGVMISARISQNPTLSFVGELRDESPILMTCFLDPEEIKDSCCDFLSLTKYAYACPIADKKAFLEKHENVKELKDGFYSFTDKPNGALGNVIFAFSKDDKWLVFSREQSFVSSTLALEKEGFAKTLSPGTLATVEMNRRNLKLLSTVIEKVKSDKTWSGIKSKELDELKDCAFLKTSFMLDKSGMSVRINAVSCRESASVSKMKLLSDDFFAFAGDSAIAAHAIAEGYGRENFEKGLDGVLAVFSKNKIKTDFISFVRKAGMICSTLDLEALLKYESGEWKDVYSKLDPKEFIGDIRNSAAEAQKEQVSSAFYGSFALKGFKPKVPLSKRFYNILPEAKGKPLAYAWVMSVYSFVKVALPLAVMRLNPMMNSQSKALLSLLPEEGDGGVAVMSVFGKNEVTCLFRITADEIKALGASVNAVMGIMMASSLHTEDDED